MLLIQICCELLVIDASKNLVTKESYRSKTVCYSGNPKVYQASACVGNTKFYMIR